MFDREGLRIPVPERGVPSPWDVGPSDFVCFSPPKQAIALSEPNFWTHSLQIHCNGLGLKIVTLQYIYTHIYIITPKTLIITINKYNHSKNIVH